MMFIVCNPYSISLEATTRSVLPEAREKMAFLLVTPTLCPLSQTLLNAYARIGVMMMFTGIDLFLSPTYFLVHSLRLGWQEEDVRGTA